MKLGKFEIEHINFGFFRLDGGAMFGSVPKNLWSKRIPADEENCIRLAARGLKITHAQRVFLIDCGMGEKWQDKQRSIFAINNTQQKDWGFEPKSITDLILTHLHFDHAGGVSFYDAAGSLKLTFPNAQIHLQESNFKNAKNPSLKERASYLPENVDILESAKLSLIDGDIEIYPGITVHRVDGHTIGQQWIEIRDGNEVIMFTTDLIPTSHHLPLMYHMGYDACAATLMKEKEVFLSKAIKENAIVFFEHDAETPAGRIHINAKGQHEIREVVHI